MELGDFYMERKKYLWYGSITQELNFRAAELLASGKITKEQYEAIVKENQDNYKKGKTT